MRALNGALAGQPAKRRREAFEEHLRSRAADVFAVRTAATDLDYRAVLTLRRAAYLHDGKISPRSRVADLGDPFDRVAKLVIVEAQGRVVGSIRTVQRPEVDAFEYERYPAARRCFPELSRCVCGSRMCVDPQVRGQGLFHLLHDQMVLAALEVGRQYVVGGAASWIRDQYASYGWTTTGITYESLPFPDHLHEFIFLDCDRYLEHWDGRREPPPGDAP